MGEVIGVLGVIASLVFVGVEVRQNTQAIRGSTYQAVAESSMNLLFYLADHPELGLQINTWGRGEELDTQVRIRVEAMVMAYLRHLENAYYQMMEGTLRAEFLENWAGNPSLSLPRVQEFWTRRREAFSEEFRRYFEQRRDLSGETSGKAH